MKLKDIGEFGLIKRIAKLTKTHTPVVKGIGDDCAILRYKWNKYLLFTTDMIIEDVHFDLKTAQPQDIGKKAVFVNVSDIAACGGVARWMVVSTGLGKDTDLKFITNLLKGIRNVHDNG